MDKTLAWKTQAMSSRSGPDQDAIDLILDPIALRLTVEIHTDAANTIPLTRIVYPCSK
jgi:hypothetical protein